MPYEIPTTDNSVTKRALFVEFLGTFALCYVGGWSVIMADLGISNIIGVALAHTFVLSFMIWAGGNISGAHYNGAVSLALYVSQHIGATKLLFYLLSQF